MRNRSEGSTERIQSFEGARPGGTLELTNLLGIKYTFGLDIVRKFVCASKITISRLPVRCAPPMCYVRATVCKASDNGPGTQIYETCGNGPWMSSLGSFGAEASQQDNTHRVHLGSSGV